MHYDFDTVKLSNNGVHMTVAFSCPACPVQKALPLTIDRRTFEDWPDEICDDIPAFCYDKILDDLLCKCDGEHSVSYYMDYASNMEQITVD